LYNLYQWGLLRVTGPLRGIRIQIAHSWFGLVCIHMTSNAKSTPRACVKLGTSLDILDDLSS